VCPLEALPSQHLVQNVSGRLPACRAPLEIRRARPELDVPQLPDQHHVTFDLDALQEFTRHGQTTVGVELQLRRVRALDPDLGQYRRLQA